MARLIDLLSTQKAGSGQGLIKAVHLSRLHGAEESPQEGRRCSDGQPDPGLGEALLRIGQSHQPRGAYEFEFGEIEHNLLAMEVNGSRQGCPYVEGGLTVDPPTKSQDRSRTVEFGRHPRDWTGR